MEGQTYRLRIWRQPQDSDVGSMVDYAVGGIIPEMSLLEMLDLLNEDLIAGGEDPVAFDSDCREGICGTCGMVVDGVAHGPKRGVATCELRMRDFDASRTIVIEPFRARSLPVIKDLVVDKASFDRIVEVGGYISVNSGSAPEANAIPISKDRAEAAFDSAACIGCAACVAACPNASASLFVGAKVSQYTFLPQGHVERKRRVVRMVSQMDAEGFGDCSNHAECEAVCPKEISIFDIGRMRREYAKAMIAGPDAA